MNKRESGIALVFVLGTVLIVSVSALAIARTALVSTAAARVGHDAERCDDLAFACDAWLRRWISSEAGAVVLDPSATVPLVNVGFIEGQLGNRAFRIDAVAFDEDAMASIVHVQGGGDLGSVVPDKVRAAVVRATTKSALITGLDQFEHVPSGLTVFPRAFGEHPTVSIAAHLALPTPRHLRVNLNTAPLELIAATYRALSVSGIEQVIDARARHVAVSVAPPVHPEQGNELIPLPVIESAAWAFRLDVTLGAIRRAWWCVYRVDGPGGFSCIQRLAIDE